SGPIALADQVAVSGDDDFASLSERLAAVSGELLVHALDELDAGRLEFTEQDESSATYAEKISPEERRLDPSLTVAELERRVRALTPHVGAYLEIEGGERLGVRSSRAARSDAAGSEAGTFLAEEGQLSLVAADGILRLETVQPPGKKPMNAADFLRGHPPPVRAI